VPDRFVIVQVDFGVRVDAMLGEGGGRGGKISFVDSVLKALLFARGEKFGLGCLAVTEFISLRFLKDSCNRRFFDIAAPTNDDRSFQLTTKEE
jgi:hypothetical protein